jgi:enediyne biosynthesis protein E4
MMKSYGYTLLMFFLLIGMTACSAEEKIPPVFYELSPDQTNITFTNTVTWDDSLNVQTDSFLYNGAGVAIGDINNNGLPDIFFSGNMVTSRLYLNLGDMQFEDITESAGITTDVRATGASMVDINNNGFLDIYVSVSGEPWSDPEERRNLLFINNGDNTFTEAAAQYLIDDPGFTTHAVFFDYNRNGYLDLFLLGNSPEEFGRGDTGGAFAGASAPNPYGVDQLYKNNGDGTFTNVSEEAGIVNRLGYGLGVVVTDLNRNGWPDIYVSNDITPNDVLYINNKDGTFSDRAPDYLRHSSFAGMGIDIADFTNNGWPDIFQTDMMSEHLSERKKMSGSLSYSGFLQLQYQGFFPHYNINTLQMNQGVTKEGDILFSETGRMAGVSYTDWSWTALFADFDNDGYKDIFVTNGYPKAVNDFDYLSEMHNARQSGDPETVKQRELEILENLHSYRVSNYLFRNNGDLTFTDETSNWGLYSPGYSYGAAYADLNNNGRLDLVINNINDTAQVFENRGQEADTSNFLQIRLQDESPNSRGLGSTLILRNNGNKQLIYHTPYRGYMSSMDDRVHFGLGHETNVDTLEVIWPDGTYQLLTDLDANQFLTVVKESTSDTDPLVALKTEYLYFSPVNDDHIIDVRHVDRSLPDFNIQQLLPYQLSRQSPAITAGDVTGNGLDDIYIGGTADTPGNLLIQQDDGSFVENNHLQPWMSDHRYEDWGVLFFDANGNGLLDLYVSSGGYRLSSVSPLLQDRLYINQGNGRFLRDNNALPEMLTSTATVKAADLNGNGLPDLFVGGRLSPRNYPFPVRSYILRNDGGTFTDITEEVAPDLINPGGMITDALWVDYNNNGLIDLVTAGEWMPVQFYRNDGGSLQNITSSLDLPPLTGWWYSLAKGDFNNNGYMDIVAGNLGLNFSFQTSEISKFGIYAADFSENSVTDLVFTQEIAGVEYPYFGLAKLGNAISSISHRFSTFEEFSNVPIHQIFSRNQLNEALHYQADSFRSTIFFNNGNDTFETEPLPNISQISPVKGMISYDFDNDGNLDLLIAGNLYQTEPNIPRSDAGNGLLLKGDGNGRLIPVEPIKSGFITPKDVKDIQLITTADGLSVIVANNDDHVQLFRIKSAQ